MNKHLTFLVGQLSQWLAAQPSTSYKHIAAEIGTSQEPAGCA